MSNKVYNERLRKLAAFLESDPHGFDIMSFTNTLHPDQLFDDPREDCGTSACAIGFLPAVFPLDFDWDQYGRLRHPVSRRSVGFWEAGTSYFNLDNEDFSRLFEPDSYDAEELEANGERVTAAMVAERIRAFIANRQD